MNQMLLIMYDLTATYPYIYIYIYIYNIRKSFIKDFFSVPTVKIFHFEHSLYLISRNSNNQIIKIYNNYCKILTQAIREAIYMLYNKQLPKVQRYSSRRW
jgi:hypothetical protein